MQKFKSKIYWTLTVLPDDPKEDWKTLVLETTKPSTLSKNITWLLFWTFETWGKLHLDNGLGELRTWRSWGLWKPLLGINRTSVLCLKWYAWYPKDLSNNDHGYILLKDKKTIINLKPHSHNPFLVALGQGRPRRNPQVNEFKNDSSLSFIALIRMQWKIDRHIAVE